MIETNKKYNKTIANCKKNHGKILVKAEKSVKKKKRNAKEGEL